MPSHHRAYAEWTPERIINWAESIGVHTARGVQFMIEEKDHPEQAYTAALGIISLSKKYGNIRVEKAAQKALSVKSFCYKTIKTMLKNKREERDLADVKLNDGRESGSTESGNQLCLEVGKNLRGQGYYH
jgi:hypothetical protein